MKAAVLKELNSYPKIEEVDFNLREGYEEVELIASALNHRDLWICKGLYAGIELPVILGSDGVGYYKGERVVINSGHNWGSNEKFQSRDFRILGMPDNGCFAEKLSIQEKYIYPAPAHLSDAECASLPLAGLTAYRAVKVKGGVEKGHKVLVTGIGGGVALFALQFALFSGAEVFVSSSKDWKLDKAKELGATDGVNYTEEDWDSSLKDMSDGFDLIIDSAGGPEFKSLVKLLRPGGRIVIYGGTRGSWNNISPQLVFWKQVSILGTTMGSDDDFNRMLQFVTNQEVKPIIDEIIPLDNIATAFTKMEKADQFGKLVLRHG